MLPTHRAMLNDRVDYDKYSKAKRKHSLREGLRLNRRRVFAIVSISIVLLFFYSAIVKRNSQANRPSKEMLDTLHINDPPSYSRPEPPIPPAVDNQANLPPPPFMAPPHTPPSEDDARYFLFTQNPPPVSLRPSDPDIAQRQQRIVDAFKHAWKGYVRDAYGKDEYMPVSRTGNNWAPGGIGLMIVDALDTLLLMNLTVEYEQARSWVATELDFDKNKDVNVFETTIRVLGGLLSAYHLSDQDTLYLEKATELGDRLVGAFKTPSGIPYPSVVLSTGLPFKAHRTSSTAEATTVQLEFKYLSHLTGNYGYWDAAELVMAKIRELIDIKHTVDGLVPILIDPESGQFTTPLIRLGSRGDSYYEYLIKQYLQTEKTETVYREMYDQAVAAIQKHLIGYSKPNELLFLGELQKGRYGPLDPKMDHLVCFIGGMFALGATEGIPTAETPLISQNSIQDFELAKQITHTCYEMYNMTATGLASEIVYFNTHEGSTADMNIHLNDRHNLLRPETVESLFMLWRLTGDPIYREWAWQIFEAFEEHTKLPDGGYTALRDVTQIPPQKGDKMDTFFLAETLKYLYLIFSPDDILPLDRYVFNTEAHPLPIFTPKPRH